MKRAVVSSLAGLSLMLVLFVPTTRSDPPPKDSEFVYARIRYHMTPEGFRLREQPWHHDYPYGDETFPQVLGEATSVKTNGMSFEVVDIDSPDLFKYPFTYLSEVGYIDLKPKDVINLREYLDRGGFIMVDDFRTSSASMQDRFLGPEDDIEHFRQEMKKVYPDRDFVRLDVSDPIFSIFYDIKSLHEPEVVAPYIFAGQGPVEFFGLRDKNGSLRMVLNNNNDISEYWEWVDEGQKSLHEATTSFHFGINYVLYAMTH
jgi:uncharacterized protein DUF4159